MEHPRRHPSKTKSLYIHAYPLCNRNPAQKFLDDKCSIYKSSKCAYNAIFGNTFKHVDIHFYSYAPRFNDQTKSKFVMNSANKND